MEGLTLDNLKDFTVTPDDDSEVFDAFKAQPGAKGDDAKAGDEVERPADPRDEAAKALGKL